MDVIADLQLHSRFSRAVSKEMTLPNLVEWSKRKGIGLIATGDWTHPLWMKEIERDLEERGDGLLQLKTQKSNSKDRNEKTDPLFLLASEVSCIYSQNGKGRRVHTLIWVPSIAVAQKINREMTKQGCNLLSDGRPIIGLTSIQVAELVLTIEPTALIIPAHAWTPWFSVYGSMSGFDSLEDAFGPYAQYIYAVETGLSSNPAMNWRIKELDTRSIVSFSDAHSGPKLGREATVFRLQELSYKAIRSAIMAPMQTGEKNQNKPNRTATKVISENSIAYTMEFYPEEGKYHYTGHRACHVRLTPEQIFDKGMTCSVCGRPLTQGVMDRVEELAGRSEASLKLTTEPTTIRGVDPRVRMVKSRAFPQRAPFVMLVPLSEIISEAIGSPVTSPKVQKLYTALVTEFDTEFQVLLSTPQADIVHLIHDERVASGIAKVRTGDIVIDPGFDGVFGVVSLWREGEKRPVVDSTKEQLSIF